MSFPHLYWVVSEITKDKERSNKMYDQRLNLYKKNFFFEELKVEQEKIFNVSLTGRLPKSGRFKNDSVCLVLQRNKSHFKKSFLRLRRENLKFLQGFPVVFLRLGGIIIAGMNLQTSNLKFSKHQS